MNTVIIIGDFRHLSFGRQAVSATVPLCQVELITSLSSGCEAFPASANKVVHPFPSGFWVILNRCELTVPLYSHTQWPCNSLAGFVISSLLAVHDLAVWTHREGMSERDTVNKYSMLTQAMTQGQKRPSISTLHHWPPWRLQSP